MASKQVTDRQKSATAVNAAIETNGASLSAALQTQLQPYLDADEVWPDLELLVVLLQRRLARLTGAMVEADETHTRELTDDDGSRIDRDRSAEELYEVIAEVRGLVDALFGPRWIESLGLAGTISRDPVVLARLGRTVSGLLAEAELPTPRIEGVSFPRELYIDRINAATEIVEGHLEAVALERREAETTMLAKHEAMSEYDACFVDSARVLSDLFRMVGEDELADRVRPSGRRPGQVEEVDELGEVEEIEEPVEEDEGAEVAGVE